MAVVRPRCDGGLDSEEESGDAISIPVFSSILLGMVVLASPAVGPKPDAADRAALSSSPRSCTIRTNSHLRRRIRSRSGSSCSIGAREPVSLTGWRFSDGVDFAFPNVTLAAGKYLVVAADVAVFTARHPGVANVVGGWTGWLRDSGETLELVDGAGAVVNTIRYAHQGDWGLRELGPVQLSHRGWQWSAATDGGGKTLELINASLPNDLGPNWTASLVDDGTPGQGNSVAASDVAPMILEVRHQPVIPRSVDPVTVTARLLDERATGLVVTLHYRLDTSTYANTNSYPQFNAASYLSVPMADDGAHGDGQANDGVFGGAIAAQANGKIVEFYLEARDATGKTRTWPAPSMVDGAAQQVTNALYQVDNSYNPVWTPGSLPVYYVIMTEMERARLAYIGNHSSLSGPDAQMNATFISVDGTGVQLRYNVAVRNRGHGTRNGPPNNQHISFAEDRLWNGRGAISFNCRYTHAQIMGSAIFRMAGLVAAYTTPVQLRINGSQSGPCRQSHVSGSMPAWTRWTAFSPSSTSPTIPTATSIRVSATAGKPSCGTWGPTPIRTAPVTSRRPTARRMTGPISSTCWMC